MDLLDLGAISSSTYSLNFMATVEYYALSLGIVSAYAYVLYYGLDRAFDIGDLLR